MYRRILKIASLPVVIFAAQWQSLNGPPAGMANDMSIGKQGLQYFIYAADSSHKLYKSLNEGVSWDSIQDEDVTNPVCVITRPNNANYVYIGKDGSTPVWLSTKKRGTVHDFMTISSRIHDSIFQNKVDRNGNIT